MMQIVDMNNDKIPAVFQITRGNVLISASQVFKFVEIALFDKNTNEPIFTEVKHPSLEQALALAEQYEG